MKVVKWLVIANSYIKSEPQCELWTLVNNNIWLNKYNKYTTLIQDVNNMGNYGCFGGEATYGNLLSAQHLWKLKLL